MPVRRLRSPEEAEDATVLDPGDPEFAARLRAIWRLSRRLCPVRFPPGVYKHRSVEAMNRQTEAWEAEAVRRQAARTVRLDGDESADESPGASVPGVPQTSCACPGCRSPR